MKEIIVEFLENTLGLGGWLFLAYTVIVFTLIFKFAPREE